MLWLRQLRIYLQCWGPVFDPWVRKIPWRRECLPTPVFLPGEFHGQRSLEGYSPRGNKASDMAERHTWLSHLLFAHVGEGDGTPLQYSCWKIPWTEEPGRLWSMGSLRVGHGWVNSLSLFTFMHWRRKWHPTPVFLPGEYQGRESPVGCHLRGRTESDTTAVIYMYM